MRQMMLNQAWSKFDIAKAAAYAVYSEHGCLPNAA